MRSRHTFLIVAPSYHHRSAGIRALYRLCHHLNMAGYPAAMIPKPGRKIRQLPDWLTPLHSGPIGDSIVVYPEIVSGNPYHAGKVVRWVLNDPGRLGGDRFYADEEMVFVFSPRRLPAVNRAVSEPLAPSRVLFLGLVDPSHIYPDPAVKKSLDCFYSAKGEALRERHPLPGEDRLQPLEEITPSMASLGEVLRRTRTLYSYNHSSNVLLEAAISGCEVLVVGEDGTLHDPQLCSCADNIYWEQGFSERYALRFHDSGFVHGFVDELRTQWDIPLPAPFWRLRRRLRAWFLGGRTPMPARTGRAPSVAPVPRCW
jgi:hypothetical protein